MKKRMFRVLAVVFLAVLIFSIYELWLIQNDGEREAALQSQLMAYKPSPTPPASPVPLASPTPPAPPASTPDLNLSAPVPAQTAPVQEANQSILDLREKYPNVVGWLTIANTKVDYPFARASDNAYYLRRGLDGNPLSAGTIFMDCRNSADFSDFNTILYGHNMKNGSMFGTLSDFDNQAFFDANPTGTVFLAGRTYTVEFFAYIVLPADDSLIYDPSLSGGADIAAFLDHVKSAARFYRDIGVTADDHILTLSTCDYEFSDARMVLLGRLS